jgi:ABC-type phosphate/phosphonate transport system substrate-binding protein
MTTVRGCPAGQIDRGKGSTAFMLLSFAVVVLIMPRAHAEEAVSDTVQIDMATIKSSLGHVNAADATAGFKTYANVFARSLNLSVSVEVAVYDDLDELRPAAIRGELETIGLPTHEFLQLRKEVALDMMFFPQKAGEITETYVIVVNTKSGITHFSQLGGKDLVVLMNSQMGMAQFWFDVLLMESGLGESKDFLRSIRTQTKPLTTVVPVFFNKADACLVTKSGFDMMSEMNPQLRRELRIIESSPPIVPYVTWIRSDFQGPHRVRLEKSFLEAHELPSGRQLLLLFQFEKMLLAQEEDLKTAVAVFEKYQKLKSRSTSITKSVP